jgi:hypothetical protein
MAATIASARACLKVHAIKSVMFDTAQCTKVVKEYKRFSDGRLHSPLT